MQQSYPEVIIGSRQRVNKTNVSKEDATQAVITYIREGFHKFDTADHYADGEEILGDARKALGAGSGQITIGTKRVPDGTPYQEGEAENAIGISLKRLQTNSIDLLQFHDREPTLSYGKERLLELNNLRKRGIIDNIGLTNASSEYISSVIKLGISIASNQVCYSLLAYRKDSKLFSVCKKNNIKIHAFGTVAGGFLSKKRLGKTEPKIEDLKNASLRKYKRFIDIIGGRDYLQKILSILEKIGKKHDASIATIASSFILTQEMVEAVVIGVRLGESEHKKENKKISSTLLDHEDIMQIEQILGEAIGSLPGDFGDEYRIDHSSLNGGHESLTATGKSGHSGHKVKR